MRPDRLRLGRPLRGSATLTVSPDRMAIGYRLSAIGNGVQLQVSICSDGPQPEKLVIDCAVHHVKANGSGTAKVFKGWSLELAPVAERTLVKHPSLRPITTR